jgi:hypothetical protein
VHVSVEAAVPWPFVARGDGRLSAQPPVPGADLGFAAKTPADLLNDAARRLLSVDPGALLAAVGGAVRYRRPPRPEDLEEGGLLRLVKAVIEAAERLDWIAMAARLDDAPSQAGELPVVIEPSSSEGLHCPYCLDELSTAPAAPCPSCGTSHHQACWDELGGCTVRGCAHQPRRRRA